MDFAARLQSGWVRSALRALAIGLFFYQLYGVATSQLPHLTHPATLGSDISNYYAAGLRLNAGHPLYGPLTTGDRLVPGYPGLYPAPLLSPPLIAVVWRVIALLPGDLAMTAWWAAGVILVAVIVVWFALRGSIATLLILNGVLLVQVPLSLYLGRLNVHDTILGWWSPVATAALSGNVNTYLLGLLVIAWWAAARFPGWAAETAIALATALKLGPWILVSWLIGRGGLRSVLVFGLALVVLGMIGLVGAGISANVDYLHLAFAGGIHPSEISLPSLLHRLLHISSTLTAYSLLLVPPAGLVATWMLRQHPRAAFATAIMAAIYSSPVVLPGNLVLLLAVAAPWPIQSQRRTRSSS